MIFAAFVSTSAGAADPFYTDLLQQGIFDLAAGRDAQAAHKLEIACFGLLDEPLILTEGLVHLGLASAKLGDRGRFVETFERIAEVEARFATYNEAAISDETRRAFEAAARQWIPSVELARVPALQSTRAAGAEGGAPASAVEETTEPATSEELLGEALRRFSAGRPRRAAPLIDQLLTLEPDNIAGLCLDGRIGQQLNDCTAVIDGLPHCPNLSTDGDLAHSYLRCLVDADMTDRGRAFEQSLDESLRARRKIRRLIDRLPPPAAAAAASAPSMAHDGVEAAPGPAGEEAPGQTDGALELSADDSALLEEVRNRIRTATSLADLDEPAQTAEKLAATYAAIPAAQFLAAEVAYRSSRWADAVGYFRQGGTPGLDQPLLRFYMAVSLFETGALQDAAAVLTDALPLLEQTNFVRTYAERILQNGIGEPPPEQ